MAEHAVLIAIDEAYVTVVDADALSGLARGVLSAEVTKDAEVHVLITDDERVRELNREYAGKDETTDVLSFSLCEGEAFVTGDGAMRLGEVIVSYPTAERQAQDAGRPVEDEVAHLLVHGVLHLLGYDHEQPDDERRMRSREEELLSFSH